MKPDTVDTVAMAAMVAMVVVDMGVMVETTADMVTDTEDMADMEVTDMDVKKFRSQNYIFNVNYELK